MSKKRSLRRGSATSGHTSADNHDSEDEVSLMPPKQTKTKWQETLINLVAAQQQQLTELLQHTKMASLPAPTPNVSGTDTANAQASTSSQASASTSFVPGYVNAAFKLTNYDPDKSVYSIKEWLDDAAKLKEELKVSDILMIAKAGEALKNRGYQYFCNWRPLSRTWDNFCNDLTIAFPDRETPGARAYRAAILRSHDCESLCDYGVQKLRCIQRFHDQLPWNTILSMVEHGLDHSEARSAVQIQKPASERELIKLLSDFDARRISSTKKPKHQEMGAWKSESRLKGQVRDAGVERRKTLKGACFKCGRQGHHQDVCRQTERDDMRKDDGNDKLQSTGVLTCNHCKKMGHTEANCYYKQKPKTAFVAKK